MRIIFYHSTFCPRCRKARGALEKIADERQDIEIEKIDVLKQPLTTLRKGVRMIPALQIDDRVLSGFHLNSKQIEQFIDKS